MMKIVPPDIEIARDAVHRPIQEIAEKMGISEEFLEPYGRYKAKISLDALAPSLKKNVKEKKRLILVSAMTPTPMGEGKTTTSVGLCDALNRIGKKSAVCLREPSLGPCFGMKGGAAGGGYAQVIPMEDINLHFTGDLHAIGAAHNLLSAILDNHLHQGNELHFDTRSILWNRVVDINDRSLRNIVIGLGGRKNSIPRESGYMITVASEIMAILCLAESLQDLRDRLGKIIVGFTDSGTPITSAMLKAHGAMTVLLKEAIKPNLVQTLEGNPAIIHGGPFANIAHGCNSLIATRMALRYNDYVVTEAGFGADLGAEKFFDIKCRKGGLTPDAVVLVATIRALKRHGNVPLSEISTPNPTAVRAGFANLRRHIENMRRFGLPTVVALNAFRDDTPQEREMVEDCCKELDVPVVPATHWSDGGEGAVALAEKVVELAEGEKPNFHYLYSDDLPPKDKIIRICRRVYGARDVHFSAQALLRLEQASKFGFGKFPICMAKTQYSFSNDPTLLGSPDDFVMEVRDIGFSAGAGFLVVLTGEIMTMPGLPKKPAAENIDIDENGNATGLF